MKRTVKAIVLVVAFVLIAATPALACGSHRMRATYDGGTVGFNPDPAAVAERCPEGFEWILQSAGVVDLKTAVYRGEAALASEHCSRWLTPPEERALGQIGGGEMILTTPDGDELWLAYEGYFKFKGDVNTAWVSRVKLRYVVTGGTGLFEDAGGRGFMALKDETNVQSGRIKGVLFLGG